MHNLRYLENNSQELSEKNQLLSQKLNSFYGNNTILDRSVFDFKSQLESQISCKSRYNSDLHNLETKLTSIKSKCNKIDQENTYLENEIGQELKREKFLTVDLTAQKALELQLSDRSKINTGEIIDFRGKLKQQIDFLGTLNEKENMMERRIDMKIKEAEEIDLGHARFSKRQTNIKEETIKVRHELFGKKRDMRVLEDEKNILTEKVQYKSELNIIYKDRMDSKEKSRKLLVKRIEEDNCKIDQLTLEIEKIVKSIRFFKW